MDSFGLLRTNSTLTSNVKVVISEVEDRLYFESFNSTSTLGDDKYKKQTIPEGSSFNIEVSKYWKGTPTNVIFYNKDINDFDIMYSEYQNQMDDTYFSGASIVKDTNYQEEFEYLFPLHIHPRMLPQDFIIFRVDGTGILDLNSDNFNSEILQNMKIVTHFDLSGKSKIGKFLEFTYNQEELPKSSIDINFNLGELTYWNGIDTDTGEFISKGKIMNEEFKKEMTFTQGNEILTNGFEDNSLIYPYIMNLKFLFNDTPATPQRLRKWSINRYYGYYGTMEIIDTITPYKAPQLKSGMKLTTNNIFNLNGVSVDPFERGYKTDRTYYVEYKSNFYLVSKVNDIDYKIISDIILPTDIDSNFNKNTITFEDNNYISYISGDTFNIDTTSDIIIVDIDGKYHRLIEDNNGWKVLSDYEFKVSNNIFRYYINETDPSYTTVINLNEVDINNPPMKFKIYQYNFKDIKDLDTSIIATDFSKFEFEFEEEITNTEEPKLYEDDLSFIDKSVIQKYLYKNKVVSIPTSSEYLATGELFEINERGTEPNKMWKKNIESVKWGVEGSISNNDYPYMFNINSKADMYNRTTDTSELIPDRQSRNMDYFYTLSNSSYNFGYINQVIYQSLSVINDSQFEIGKYFNYNYDTDYFDELFGQNETFNNITKPVKKYSYLIKGDQVYPNQTLFKGINVSIYDIDSVLTNIVGDKKIINSFNINGTNNFENYKFSILLSDLSQDIDSDFTTKINNSDWRIIKKWEKNQTYNQDDVTIFDSYNFKDSNGQYGFNGYGTESATGSLIATDYIYPDGTKETLTINNITNEVTVISPTGPNNGISQMYQCSGTTIITDPNKTILDDINWNEYPSGYRTIFYSPDITYTAWDSISGSYSYLIDKTGVDYNYLNYFIYFDGEFYKCTKTQSIGDNKTPHYIGISLINGLQVEYWSKIESYISTKNYTSDEIVTINNDLYYYNNTTQNLDLILSFDPVSKTPYEIYNVIKFNGNFYIDNVGGSSLDNGINIYVNKKWGNILSHIYFNDGISPVYNINRDNLYSPELQQIVASNFIETINSFITLNGFINSLNYYVIEEDGSFQKYDISNIEDLPVLIQMETPVEIEYYSHSLNKKSVDINQNILKVRKYLENNELIKVEQVNYYNNSNIAIQFKRLDGFDWQDKTEILYRFNGLYNPIFNNINLFDNINGNRYNFNTNLNNFGEIKELMKSKVGEKNLLRITDDNYKSVFPQVDEIGYFIDNQNIFKSTWDKSYYKKIITNK